jgi:hypothetical protein
MKQLNIILLGIIISPFSMPTVYAQPYRKDEIPGGSKKPIGRGDAESSNCDKDRTSGEWRDYGCPLHGTRCDNQSVWFVFIGCEKVLSILVTLTRFHGAQRISGVAIKNEGESSFRSLVAVNYWQCHMLFMPERQMPYR